MARRPRDDDRGLLPFEHGGGASGPGGGTADARAARTDADADGDDRLRLARGPRAVEACLERDVVAHVAAVRADPSRLARSLTVVVPSRALRDHVQRRVASWCGGAAAGVAVVTLRAWSRTLALRAGLPPPRGTRAFDLALARALPEVQDLARALGRFDDPIDALRGTLADMFDAGFEAEQAEALDEALRDARGGGVTDDEIARARHVVALAVSAARHHASRGFTRDAEHTRRVAEALRARPELAGGTVAIHGFADATGSSADLLEALARTPGARVYVDTAADGAFGANLRARFGAPTRTQAPEPRDAPAPAVVSARVAAHVASHVALRAAVSLDAEVRAAADAIRAALDAGAAPETIGLVARDLGPYRSAIERHFGRLGVPYSAPGTAAHDGGCERRVRAAIALLHAGAGAPLDRWLDARGGAAGPAYATPTGLATIASAEARVALRVLGLARLDELANLDLVARLGADGDVVLPVRALRWSDDLSADDDADGAQGGANGDAGTDAAGGGDDDVEGHDEPRAARGGAAGRSSAPASVRRRVARATIERLAREARALVASFAAWPAGTTAEHVRRARAWVDDQLGWAGDDDARRTFDGAVAALADDLGSDARLERDEFLELLRTSLDDSIGRAQGGRGLGVRVLSVTEARGATFAVLHVLGLVRGRFPRNVNEDALLPDAVRARLRPVLPDLPLKFVGRDEERVLFDQLVASAPDVHLSWPTTSDDDKALFSSPLLESVATAADIAAAPVLPDVLSTVAACDPRARGPRIAYEHATLAGLRSGQDALAPRLGAAVGEARACVGLDPGPSSAIATARSGILREHEGSTAGSGRLGPYLGFVGAARDARDPRSGDLYVTTLENLADCGWRAFLQRVLRLAPPLDPLASLPEIDPRLVGDVVHAVLDLVARPAGGRTSEERRVAWPRGEAFEEQLRAATRTALVERGILLAGFDELVMACVRPLLDVARTLDDREATSVRLIDSETERAFALPPGPHGARELRLRIDRLDRTAAGERATDFKTGRPLSSAKTAQTRRQHHLNGVGRGRKLQAFGYARALGPGASGRYVFLRDGLEDDTRVFEVTADDADAAPAFDGALRVLLAAWDGGAFFPRLLNANAQTANPACSHCEVAQACLRGDSAANRRLARFTQSSHVDPDHVKAAELWRLAQTVVPVHAEADGDAPAAGKKRGKSKKGRDAAGPAGADA